MSWRCARLGFFGRRDLAHLIHNADAGLLDRHVQSSKWSMLRLSFCGLRPLKRTSFHHQPEAQHLKSSAIHKLPADYPICSVAMAQSGNLTQPHAPIAASTLQAKNDVHNALHFNELLRVQVVGHLDVFVVRPGDLEGKACACELNKPQAEMAGVGVVIVDLDVADTAVIVLKLTLNDKIGVIGPRQIKVVVAGGLVIERDLKVLVAELSGRHVIGVEFQLAWSGSMRIIRSWLRLPGGPREASSISGNRAKRTRSARLDQRSIRHRLRRGGEGSKKSDPHHSGLRQRRSPSSAGRGLQSDGKICRSCVTDRQKVIRSTNRLCAFSTQKSVSHPSAPAPPIGAALAACSLNYCECRSVGLTCLDMGMCWCTDDDFKIKFCENTPRQPEIRFGRAGGGKKSKILLREDWRIAVKLRLQVSAHMPRANSRMAMRGIAGCRR